MIKNVEEHVDMMMIIHQTEKEHLHLPTIISRHTVYFAAMIGTTGSRIFKLQECGPTSLLIGGSVFHR